MIYIAIIVFILLFLIIFWIQKKKDEMLDKFKGLMPYINKQERKIKSHGADFFIKDNITIRHWYMYKLIMGVVFTIIMIVIAKLIDVSGLVESLMILVGFAAGFMFLNLYLHLANKKSNTDMLFDVMEMSRSVLYSIRGGQYISDALRVALLVVSNKRLKSAMVQVNLNLASNQPIDKCLEELEQSFNNAEISSFATVIRSLMTTGQVEEALKALESNIAREQAGVNKRRLVILENRTMLYVMLIAMSILVILLYCIVMKIMELEIMF